MPPPRKNTVPKKKIQEAAKKSPPTPLPPTREFADFTPDELHNATEKRQSEALKRNGMTSGRIYSYDKANKVLGNVKGSEAEMEGEVVRRIIPRLNREQAARTDRTTRDPFKKKKGK